MYVYRNLHLGLIWRFGWINFLVFIFWGSLVYYLHLKFDNLVLSFSLLSTVGVGVSIYLSFKNSQSYDRQWEARKIWGEMAGKSKILTNQAHVYIQREDKILHAACLKEIVMRQLAFLNATRLHLRKPALHSRKYHGLVKVYYFGKPTESQWEEEVWKFMDKIEVVKVKEKSNIPYGILSLQYNYFYELRSRGLIDEFRQMDMNKTIDSCIEALGKCERIKHTPFPRQYAYFSKAFVWIFVLLLPFGLLGQLTGKGIDNYLYFIGLNTLISWVFVTMELVGDYSEDPFENFASDVPLTSICRNVEIDLLSFIGEHELPEKIKDKDGYLL